jgi:hypothetical protein
MRSLKPFVPSGKDFALARRFFQDLGFSVAWEGGAFAELQQGGAAFILQNLDHEELQRNFMLRVEVDDLDAFWKQLCDSGVLERYPGVKAKEPTLFPWGREVHLIDPAGVCWHFA